MITGSESQALVGIVGEKWVATDPCTLDSYAFYMNPEALNKEGGRFTPRPAAVVMPGDTREVQEIVRLCNQSDLMVKPFSTGICAMGSPSHDRVITLDLKRMDRIIDIDLKNQIAVVEPYVRAIDLQTRIMKHGLNCHVVSAGGQHSLLASATSAWGTGINGPSMGYSGRNLLGVEWVLPTGEVLTIGSAGDGAGWFSPDGPGPAVRGIVRGFQGAFGGLGVFTKCALKLYRWDGPPGFEAEGRSPNYLVKEKPSRVAFHAIVFPTSDAMREAGYALGEAEIEYAQFRTPMFFLALGMTPHNTALKALLETGILQKIARYALMNAVVGYSEGEFRWKLRVLRQIVKETGGVILPNAGLPMPGGRKKRPRQGTTGDIQATVGKMDARPSRPGVSPAAGLVQKVDDPLWLLRRFPFLQTVLNTLVTKLPFGRKRKMETLSNMVWLLVRHATNAKGTLRPSQALATTLGSLDTWDLGIAQADWIAERKKEAIRQGLILDDGGDLGCGGTFEGAHMGYLEGIVLYSAGSPASCLATDELIRSGAEACVDSHLGIPIAGFGKEMNAVLGPACHDYDLWLSRIKKALDPHTASDPFFYSEPEPVRRPEPEPGAR